MKDTMEVINMEANIRLSRTEVNAIRITRNIMNSIQEMFPAELDVFEGISGDRVYDLIVNNENFDVWQKKNEYDEDEE